MLRKLDKSWESLLKAEVKIGKILRDTVEAFGSTQSFQVLELDNC